MVRSIGGNEFLVTASIGIVERAVADTDPTELIRAADITLHWAKADGKSIEANVTIAVPFAQTIHNFKFTAMRE